MRYFIFLFFPVLLFSQVITPRDTLYLKNGQVFPCSITSIEKNLVKVLSDEEGVESAASVTRINKIFLEDNGIIYTSENGYSNTMDYFETYTTKRIDRWEKELQRSEEEKERQKELEERKKQRLQQIAEKNIYTPEPDDEVRDYSGNVENKWSFGVYYVPEFSGELSYYRVYSLDDDNYYITSNSASSLFESHLTYSVLKNLRLFIDVGFISVSDESRSETHTRYIEGDSESDYGYDNEADYKFLNINFGCKYYLTGLKENRVRAFVSAGFGKQLAFIEQKAEDLFSDDEPDYQLDNNMKEFLEEMNSPWNFNIGFGAEYYFNKSLSLYSAIKIYYLRRTAEYNERYLNDTYTRSSQREIKNSGFNTRIGLGLNFYF